MVTGSERQAAIRVFDTPERAAEFLLNFWAALSLEAKTERGRFTVALSGGATPTTFYDHAAKHPRAVPWDMVHVFLVDERCVPSSDPASNYRLIRDRLAVPLSLPEAHLNPVVTEDRSPKQSAADYERRLLSFFGFSSKPPVFDLVMLGIGDDGHTASLFPNAATLKETKRLVLPARADRAPYDRVTMTFPLINSARNVVFLVTGRSKASILRRVVETPGKGLPASMVMPLKGNLYYLVDREAAAELDDAALQDGCFTKPSLESPLA